MTVQDVVKLFPFLFGKDQVAPARRSNELTGPLVMLSDSILALSAFVARLAVP